MNLKTLLLLMAVKKILREAEEVNRVKTKI